LISTSSQVYDTQNSVHPLYSKDLHILIFMTIHYITFQVYLSQRVTLE